MITIYDENGVAVKTASEYTYDESDMGESSLSVNIKFSSAQEFHPDWHVSYKGEVFRLGVRKPSGYKDTSSLSTIYTLVFKSEREDLKRYTFIDLVELESGNMQPSSYVVPLVATLTEMVDRFNLNLGYYGLSERWAMSLPDDYVESGKTATVQFDGASLWDVLLKLYELYETRWVIAPDDDMMNILVASEPESITHVFEYGVDKGLDRIERNNELNRLVTRLRGRGGSKNLPHCYFHSTDGIFPGDPNVPSGHVLNSMFYNALMPKSYRDYVRGYNAGYGTGTWAYEQGVADKVAGKPMNLIDFVRSDREALWGISYGTIAANEDIYPTLQGISDDDLGRLDEVVAVSPVTVDGPGAASTSGNAAIAVPEGEKAVHIKKSSIGNKFNKNIPVASTAVYQAVSGTIVVENALNDIEIIATTEQFLGYEGSNVPLPSDVHRVTDVVLELLLDDEVVETRHVTSDTLYVEMVVKDLEPGEYTARATVTVDINSGEADTMYYFKTRVHGMGYEYSSEASRVGFSKTFDIWIKNIWNSEQDEDESDEDYVYRVWEPLVSSSEMTVMWSDGMLAGDYEFKVAGVSTGAGDNLRSAIISAIHHDTSKTLDGVQSEWRLTLEKSDAELEASGRYLPNSMQNAVAGNHLFFVNIEMPWDPYVYNAEARLEAYLVEQLALLDEEFPSFTLDISKVFGGAFNEAGKIRAGAKIKIRNSELIGVAYTELYIQSLSISYSATSLNPEYKLTLSDEVVATGNPISILEGQVKKLSGDISAQTQLSGATIDKSFLRKDGPAQESYSPTTFKEDVAFAGNAHDTGFERGDLTGKGAGVYTDGDGNRVVEADILVARRAARFNELRINQITATGGKQIFSAANLQISAIEDIETETVSAWRCYFDSKRGVIRNMFSLYDGAFCQRFVDETASGYLTYWRRVVGVGADYIDISKTDAMVGSGEPAVGDNVAQLGNSTDGSRQAALIIDEVRDGGGIAVWYDNITGYTLEEKDSISIGRVLQSDGETYKTMIRAFGDAYFGSRNQTSFLQWNNTLSRFVLKGAMSQSPAETEPRALPYFREEGYSSNLYYYEGDWLRYGSPAISYIHTSPYISKGIAPDSGALDPDNKPIWTEYGGKGADGINTAEISLYMRRGDGAPDWAPGDLSYNFETGALTEAEEGALQGWSRTIPTQNPSQTCYCIKASIQSRETSVSVPGGWVWDEDPETGERGSWNDPAAISGDKGAAGKVMRGVNEFSTSGLPDGRGTGIDGYQGLNETDPTFLYYDMVYRETVESGSTVRRYYYCKNGNGATSHIPGVTSGWENYWSEANNFEFVATKVLYAALAYVENLGVNVLKIAKNGSVLGGFMPPQTDDNGDFMLWAGAATPGAAPFSVDRNGAINATTGNFSGFVRMPFYDFQTRYYNIVTLSPTRSYYRLQYQELTEEYSTWFERTPWAWLPEPSADLSGFAFNIIIPERPAISRQQIGLMQYSGLVIVSADWDFDLINASVLADPRNPQDVAVEQTWTAVRLYPGFAQLVCDGEHWILTQCSGHAQFCDDHGGTWHDYKLTKTIDGAEV